MSRTLVLMPAGLSAALFCTPALHALNQSVDLVCLAATKASAEIARCCAAGAEVLDTLDEEHLRSLIQNRPEVLWLDLDHSAEASEPTMHIADRLVGIGANVRRLSEELGSFELAGHPVERARGWLLSVASGQTPAESSSDDLMGGFPLAASADAQSKVARLMSDDRPMLLVHLGCHGVAAPGWRFWQTAGHPNAWPLDGFLQVAAALRQVFDEPRVVLTGTGIEGKLTQPFARQTPDSINLVDQTDVPLLLALAERAELVVGNLTGPIHLACATSAAVVAIARETGEEGSFADAGAALFPASAARRIASGPSLESVSPAKVLSECLIALKAAGRLPN
ncbi:MAG: hypothetical protein NXH85_03050 [Pseudomonadaceae bacterium]|nr:hypothetical protein [Pseudomonadaceae bacterium]